MRDSALNFKSFDREEYFLWENFLHSGTKNVGQKKSFKFLENKFSMRK